MIFNYVSESPQEQEVGEELSDLELTIELELPAESELEITVMEEMSPELPETHDEYLQQEMERQEKQEQEDLASMLQPRIP